MPHLRRDPISGHVVWIAAERVERPEEFEQPPAFSRAVVPCPFCPELEGETPEPRVDFPPGGPWLARQVPNRFPAVDTESGRHEVIIESPRHLSCWGELSAAERRASMIAYRERLRAALDAGLPYAQIFKNSGHDAGASLSHAHSQLIATPEPPRAVLQELAGARAWRRRHGACYFCQLGEGETAGGLVATTPAHRCVCPPASRFPFECWVLPRPHRARFEESSDEELADLAELLAQVVVAWRRTIGHVDYNWYLHTTPRGSWGASDADQNAYHWHLELFPRLARMAGYELATGQFINLVDPDHAAERLRGRDPGRNGG
jgi:UDPglucose--hexose-1-phosphate uridylyltransferase